MLRTWAPDPRTFLVLRSTRETWTRSFGGKGTEKGAWGAVIFPVTQKVQKRNETYRSVLGANAGCGFQVDALHHQTHGHGLPKGHPNALLVVPMVHGEVRLNVHEFVRVQEA